MAIIPLPGEKDSILVHKYQNRTKDVIHNHDNGLVYVESILVFILFIWSAFGNGLVCAAVLKYRSLRTRTNMFMFSLSLTDFTIAFTCILPVGITLAIKNHNWLDGNYLCSILAFLMGFLHTMSTYSLAGVAFLRFFKIVLVSKYYKFFTKTTVLVYLLCFIIISFAINSLPFFGIGKFEFSRGHATCFVTMSSENRQFRNLFYVFGVILPFIVMTVCYASILYTMKLQTAAVLSHRLSRTKTVIALRKLHAERAKLAEVNIFDSKDLTLDISKTSAIINSAEKNNGFDAKDFTLDISKTAATRDSPEKNNGFDSRDSTPTISQPIVTKRPFEEMEKWEGIDMLNLKGSTLNISEDNERERSVQQKQKTFTIGAVEDRMCDSRLKEPAANFKLSNSQGNEHDRHVKATKNKASSAVQEPSFSNSPNIISKRNKFRELVKASRITPQTSTESGNSTPQLSRSFHRMEKSKHNKKALIRKRHESNSRNTYHRRVTMNTLLVVIAYFISWLPSFVITNISIYSGENSKVPDDIVLFGELFVFLSACVNPLIYAMRDDKFRKCFKKMLTKFCSSHS